MSAEILRPADYILRDRAARKRSLWRIGIAAVAAAVCIIAFLFLFIRGSFEFAMERRLVVVATMIIIAFAQALATIVFHTVTQNRILTPSIMGFESMYVLIQTASVFFFSGQAMQQTNPTVKVVAQTAVMVLFATLLYRWLFSGRFGNLHILLLVGVVLGVAFGSFSTFLQRMLTPSDFDVLQGRLIGKLSNTDPTNLPWALLVCVVIGVILWRRRDRLDVLALGSPTATNLGVTHRRELTVLLLLVAILISVATTLVGPMTFFGFIVATLAYQITGSNRHALLVPMAWMLGIIALVGGQFVLEHVFYAAGYLAIIIEFVGGVFFLVYLLRKGTL